MLARRVLSNTWTKACGWWTLAITTSELLFCIDQYNRGGYKLFYDDFKKRAVFQFNYH